MAFTDREREIARQIKEQGGSRDDFLDVLQQIRLQQPAEQVEQPKEVEQVPQVSQASPETIALRWWPSVEEQAKTSASLEFISNIPKAEEKAWLTDFLENDISDAITEFWRSGIEEAKAKITPATGKEIPFTADSKLAENILPSLEKVGGWILEVVGSPVDSIVNLASTLKAIVVKWAENSSWFKHFIKSSEWDKAIQEALSKWFTHLKDEVAEKWFITVVNKAVQEDPALAATMITSIFKKFGKLATTDASTKAKIDELDKAAADKIKEFIKPTKETTKSITKRITPELSERIRTGEIKPADREAILALAEEQVQNFGQQIGDFIKAWKVKWEINFDGMIDALAKEDAKLRIDGAIKPGNELSVRFIEKQLDFLGSLEAKYGKNIPSDKQVELRKLYDTVFDKTITRDKISKFQDEMDVKLADVLRAELAKNNPELAELNKNFTFYKGLETVLDETVSRTQWHDTIWLIATIRQNAQGGAGAVVGGAAGGVIGWPAAIAAGAILWGTIGAKITKVTSSPKYKLVDAKKKLAMADAIAEGNATKLEKILDSIIIAQGLSALPEGE